MKKLSAEDFAHLDIPAVVETYTSTRLTPNRTQCVGACPYDDCSGDDDGFIVYYTLTARECHFYCRSCKRAGDIVKLLQDILQKRFSEVCDLLDIGKGKAPLTISAIRQELERKAKERQEKQIATLSTIARTSMRGLQHDRARAYLLQRGIPLEIAREHGLCYIPSLKEMTEEQRTCWWDMRQWTDRLIFPLSDGGYTGRALFLWAPGMDENEHKKKLDDFNARVQAHNKPLKRKDWKEEIPRWYTTPTQGYFHGEALAAGEHVTIVEGAFDALALLAAGVTDVVAAGRNGINSDHIPVNICYATIAFDGDAKGQGGAAMSEKVFRRKGIKTDTCSAPDDGKGKDWSERYKLSGIAGLSAILLRPGATAAHKSTVQERGRALLAEIEQRTAPSLYPLDESFLDLPEELRMPIYTDIMQSPVHLCYTCLEPGAYERDGLMYCEAHDPAKVHLLKFAEQVSALLPGMRMQVYHTSQDAEMKAAALQDLRDELYRKDELEHERVRAANERKAQRARETVQQNMLVSA